MCGFVDTLIPSQVYEVLLVTKGNVTPVGITREGNSLKFKLFGGKSYAEIMEYPHASLQATNDVGLVVRLALNLPPLKELEFENLGPYRWIKGLPGVYGDVRWSLLDYSDDLGETKVLAANLIPKGEIKGSLPPRPFSRADCALIEMAVDFTRLPFASGSSLRRLYQRIAENYHLYRRLGGKDPIGKMMMEKASELGLSKEFKQIQ